MRITHTNETTVETFTHPETKVTTHTRVKRRHPDETRRLLRLIDQLKSPRRGRRPYMPW